MARYYVNKNAQDNGDHEVHVETCDRLPKPNNRIDLGIFSSCHGAVKKAKEEHYRQSNGCKFCSYECHTS